MKKTIEQISAAIADADARGNRLLYEANVANEAGKKDKATRLYDKGQFWMDRSNALRDQLIAAKATGVTR